MYKIYIDASSFITTYGTQLQLKKTVEKLELVVQ